MMQCGKYESSECNASELYSIEVKLSGCFTIEVMLSGCFRRAKKLVTDRLGVIKRIKVYNGWVIV